MDRGERQRARRVRYGDGLQEGGGEELRRDKVVHFLFFIIFNHIDYGNDDS